MKHSTSIRYWCVFAGFAFLSLFCGRPARAELVAYWPLDVLDGGVTTPDVAGGFDMDAYNLIDADVVPGKIGNAFAFANANQTLLSRVHDPADPLPINKHPAFTISMWAQVKGTGQTDLRLFSEGSTTDTNPLFNLGTDSGGATDALDFYIRSTGNNGHPKSVTTPFDGTWRHLAWVFENGTHTLYVDGKRDDASFTWPAFSDLDPVPLDNTSIGGIQRNTQSHWVTGLIDDVAMWDEVLADTTIGALALELVTPDDTDFLVGDFNLDSVIDVGDFNILANNFREGTTYTQGDINFDGMIDLHDFGAFVQVYAGQGNGAAMAGVPEPSGMLLALSGLFWAVLRRPAAGRRRVRR